MSMEKGSMIHKELLEGKRSRFEKVNALIRQGKVILSNNCDQAIRDFKNMNYSEERLRMALMSGEKAIEIGKKLELRAKWKDDFRQLKTEQNNIAMNCYGCAHHETEWMDGGHSNNLCKLKNESHDNDGCEKRYPKPPYILESEESIYIAGREKAQEEINKQNEQFLGLLEMKDLLRDEILNLKKELKCEREAVNEIAKQSINQEEFESKGGEDYDETDHRGGYEECVRVCRQTQKQRKVIL